MTIVLFIDSSAALLYSPNCSMLLVSLLRLSNPTCMDVNGDLCTPDTSDQL